MDAALEKYFLSQVQPQPTPIHALIGLRDQTLSKIPVKRFITDSGNQLAHSWLAPAIGFYKGGMTDQIVIAGHLGINEELFDPSWSIIRNETSWRIFSIRIQTS